MTKIRAIHNTHGVALVAALFVMMIMSILAIGLLSNVDDELKMGKAAENSERALKIAETGIQIARAKFFDPAIKELRQTTELSSVDGFYRGGYFLAQLESGFRGAEKWTQWRYDAGSSAHNPISEIVAPVFRVWGTGNTGVNGSWRYEGSQQIWMLNVRNLYPIVARGMYFPIEESSGDTLIRAHDEYSGKQTVKNEGETVTYWLDDKSVLDKSASTTATFMSAMATFSDYSSVPGSTEPILNRQRIYFTYAGHDSTNIPATSADTTTTVRLRAVNALNNNNADQTMASLVWEFDTGMHGIGTAPVFIDPDPDVTGDEIVYFAVATMGTAGGSGALDLNENGDRFINFPRTVSHESQQIHIFAIVDLGTTYRQKWTTPFPDPALVDSTDYPVAHAGGSDGLSAPYVRVAADMEPFMPEQDLLPDYRDGTGQDGQTNHVRGNIGWNTPPPALSPPVVSVLYEDSSGNLTDDRAKASATSKNDPRIDIYLSYSAWSRMSLLYGGASRGFWANNMQWDGSTNGWGPDGLRKPNAIQTRVISLRDRLVRESSAWNWDATASRFPIFKWTYRVPGHDPGGTDARPWKGYGEYTWDTLFEQDIAPLLRLAETDQRSRAWSAIKDGGGNPIAGDQNAYPVLYLTYESMGFPNTGFDNTLQTYTRGPTTTQGSPVDFSGQVWTDSRVMVMALRDTWDDYIAGYQTNYLYDETLAANPTYTDARPSNPVEPYWVHDHNAATICDTTDAACPPLAHTYPSDSGKTVIAYNMSDTDTAGNTLQMPYAGNTFKVGFPRPYVWSESLWNANVRDADLDETWSMNNQGWKGAGFDTTTPHISKNIDVRGDNSAMCTECLFGDGLLVAVFQESLTTETTGDFKRTDDLNDLRLHGINATSGIHVWDFHAASEMYGDKNNASPAIANGKVFWAYKKEGERTVMLEILSSSDGEREQEPGKVDEYADALILSPTIANGAVYIGTYSLGLLRPDNSNGSDTPSNYVSDDIIRVFALSPVLRLVSTGMYPLNYANYTGNSFRNITMLQHDALLKDTGESFITGQGRVPTSKRKLQVWITGGNSKWEEVREILQR